MTSRILAATLAAGVNWAACAAQPAAPADLVLVNGTILTVNPNDEVVEAIAVSNGRISAVGTSNEIRALVGSRTQVIDLQVWDRNMYTISTDDLKQLKCELTLLKGKVVFHDPGSPVEVRRTDRITAFG